MASLDGRQQSPQAEQAADIVPLKRALAQKGEEAAILKKTMAYLARESR